MQMKRMGTALAVVAGVVFGSAAVAGAAPAEMNAPQLCRATGNVDGFLASHGGCVSSVASIGVDELMEGAFPSTAAAIANCKGIEEMVGGFPYYFYGRVGDARYLATNYQTCTAILLALHTGQLQPGPAAP